MIEFPKPPPEGFVVVLNGQAFRSTGPQSHRKSDGTTVTLAGWEADCADCGQAFSLATASAFAPNRRCPMHRKPGRPVKRPRT